MTDFTFEGFEPANTTPVPDILFDQLLAELNESELKVLLYIIRRTAGFKKQTDAISLNQFQKGIRKRATGEILDRGCGIKDRATIVKALASLEKKGCIQADKSNDPQGDKATSVYRIKFRSEVVGKTNHPTHIGSGQNQPPWFAKPTTGSGQNQPGVVGDSNPQETVIQPNSSQETDKQEGTIGADRATPAPVTSHSPTEGHDDDTSNNNPTGSTAHGNTRHPAHDLGVQTTTSEVAPGSGGYEKDDETQKRAAVRPAQQLSTGAGTSPQQSAKVSRPVAPARPAQSGRKGSGKQSYQVYFSTEGAAFRSMYEEITGMQLDETAANARACNALGKKQGVDHDTIKAVQARIDADKWLSDHNIFVGVQELASDDGKWRWENWVRLVRKTRQAKQPPTRQQDPYSIAALLEEQNPGYHARKEANSWIN